jgi:hypothetical protein
VFFLLPIWTSGERRNAYRILMRMLEGRSPLGRPRCGGVDNIKMHLRQIG